MIIQRATCIHSWNQRKNQAEHFADTGELPILPTEKPNVFSAPEYGCTKMSYEKAIWSDIHDEVIREQLQEPFVFSTLCGPFASHRYPAKSLSGPPPSSRRGSVKSRPSHMPILMLWMIWKIAERGKQNSSDTRQHTAGNPTPREPCFSWPWALDTLAHNWLDIS